MKEGEKVLKCDGDCVREETEWGREKKKERGKGEDKLKRKEKGEELKGKENRRN